ncbi:MAG: AsnC family protein [Acidocella sp.]|nr:AsnC family protein [Acidocella sp.]
MPAPRDWTETADNTIKQMRADGATWASIGVVLGLSRNTIIERGRRIQALGGPVPPRKAERRPEDEPNRAPLHAGHPIAWAVLTDGTLLEGTLYVPMGAGRQELAQ